MNSALLEVSDLRCELGGREVLSGIDLSVAPHDNLAIVGPNGSGKSTLLKCMVGILANSKGTISLKCKPLDQYSARERARIVSYLPQSIGMIFSYTVKDFVTLSRFPHLSYLGGASCTDDAEVEEALMCTATTHLSDRVLSELSGGEKQKVLLAACLVQRVPLVFLDEPTTFLDPHHQIEMFEVLRRVRQQRELAVVWVTHDINAALVHAERILALKDGTVVYDGDAKDFVSQKTLERMYDRTFPFVQHPSRQELRLVVPEGEPF